LQFFAGAGLMFLAVIASKLNKIDRQLAERPTHEPAVEPLPSY
jgi:hypothetical protein